MLQKKTPTLILALGFLALLAGREPAHAQQLNRAMDKSFEDLTPAERIAIRAAAKVAYKKKELSTLHVCSDPGNMPLSNIKRQGFENKIIELLGKALGAQVVYHWQPLIDRGFTRSIFDQRACDVMVDIPEDYDGLLVTEPLYRSTYVLAYPTGKYNISGLNDPQLKKLTIGVFQTSGIRQALLERGIFDNVKIQTQSEQGDLVPKDQPWYLVQEAMDGKIDVAGVWGPFAGWVKTMKHEQVTLVPVNLDEDRIPLEFSLGLGVRPTDVMLRYMLEYAMEDHKDEIQKILDDYGVPLVKCSNCVIPGTLPSHGSYTEAMVAPDKGPSEAEKQAAAKRLAQAKEDLKNGADPTQELYYAVTGGDPARVKLAVDHGAKINQMDNTGNAPIDTATMAGDTRLVKLLVKLGANPNLVDDSGMTPLLYAIAHDDAKTAKALIEAGADINKANKEGYTPLAMAIADLNFETAKELINAGANVNKPVGKDQLTPLMVAVAQTHLSEGTIPLPTTTRPIDIDRALIQKGAKVNAQAGNGNTALMIAASRDNAAAIGLLLNSGADYEMKNKQGQTALDIAKMNDAQSAAQAISILGPAMQKRAQSGTDSNVVKQ